VIKIILLLVYLTGGGELKIEQKAFDAKSPEACNDAGRARIEEIMTRDPAVEGLFAGCVMSKVTDA
jgi:hypothetical protein